MAVPVFNMRNSWIIGLCSILVAGIAGAAEKAVEGWKTYRNHKFGYEISYPAEMEYRAYADGSSGELEDVRTGHRLLDFEVWPPGECPRQPTNVTAKELGIDRAKVATQADGPDGSSYCGDPVTVREYASLHGAKIYELELTCIREAYAGQHEDSIDNEPDAAPSEAQPVLTAEGKKGPTFFVDISPSWMKRVLSADPVGVDPRMQPTKEKADLAVVRKILGTLKTFPTQKPPGICIEELQHRGFPVGIRPR